MLKTNCNINSFAGARRSVVANILSSWSRLSEEVNPTRRGTPCCVTQPQLHCTIQRTCPRTNAHTRTHSRINTFKTGSDLCEFVFAAVPPLLCNPGDEDRGDGVRSMLLNPRLNRQNNPGCPSLLSASKLHRTRTWHRLHLLSSSGVFGAPMGGRMDALARGLIHKSARLTSATAGLDQSNASRERNGGGGVYVYGVISFRKMRHICRPSHCGSFFLLISGK